MPHVVHIPFPGGSSSDMTVAGTLTYHNSWLINESFSLLFIIIIFFTYSVCMSVYVRVWAMLPDSNKMMMTICVITLLTVSGHTETINHLLNPKSGIRFSVLLSRSLRGIPATCLGSTARCLHLGG